jgi:hypothetical protein
MVKAIYSAPARRGLLFGHIEPEVETPADAHEAEQCRPEIRSFERRIGFPGVHEAQHDCPNHNLISVERRSVDVGHKVLPTILRSNRSYQKVTGATTFAYLKS